MHGAKTSRPRSKASDPVTQPREGPGAELTGTATTPLQPELSANKGNDPTNSASGSGEPVEDSTPAPLAPAPAPAPTPAPSEAPSNPVGSGPIRWAPPALVDPKTIELGTGYTHTSMATSRDYIIKLPPTRKVGATWLDGGHNVVVMGGSVTIPMGTPPGVENDAQRTGIYIKGATGTVDIEGVSIEGSGAEFDGVDIAAPLATVQLENLRIIGVKGRFSAFHGDMVQPWGGVKDLRIDHLTGTSNYQGLTLQQDLGPIGSAEISNVDLTATTEPPLDLGGHMIWLTTDSNTCTDFPVTLSNVFVKPRPELTLATSVWPASNSNLSCKESGATFATWPSLSVTGGVQEGLPPGGSFVPPGAAGLGYVSPGYSGS
jgi:hypothetical protein